MEIRTDYRVILDILEALNDPDLNNAEKAEVLIRLFYVEPEEIPDLQAAIETCYWFIEGGEEKDNRKRPRLMDWEQDFPIIISAINRVYGGDVRGIKYDRTNNTGGLHWWTFMAAYTEIGDCYFAQVVRIRDKRARGKKLDKEEKAWYKENRAKVDLKHKYSEAEEELLSALIGGK